ncbi:MAG: hypothetical protein ACR2HJ_09285 [Fimbriimonadales bacterium]
MTPTNWIRLLPITCAAIVFGCTATDAPKEQPVEQTQTLPETVEAPEITPPAEEVHPVDFALMATSPDGKQLLISTRHVPGSSCGTSKPAGEFGHGK